MTRKIFYSFLSLIAVCLSACDSLDDDRIPLAPVNIPFTTIGDWQVYGVNSALDAKRFIKSERIPADYPFTDISQTGFGGVLLVGDFEGNPRAYDLSCPVECKSAVRIFVNQELHVGECPECHSTYDIFRFGEPLSGKAAENGYGLRRYRVFPATGVYMLIAN